MLYFTINTADSILTLEPSGPLLSSDFEAVGKALDPYLDQHGKLDGLLIHAPSFPGWKDFAAFLSHIRFVKNHQHYIKRVAAVSDSRILSILPDIAGHFIQSEVQHFNYADKDSAITWLKGES